MTLFRFPVGVALPVVRQLVFYISCLWPLSTMRLSNPSGLGNSRFFVAASFILLCVVAQGLLVWLRREPNYYEVFGVGRDVTALHLRKIFKKLKRKFTGVENPMPPALKHAYGVLMDLELRHVYDKFGPDGLANDMKDEIGVLSFLAFFYVVWGVMTVLVTPSPALQGARNYAMCALIALLVVEMSLAFEPKPTLPPWFVPNLAEFELREALRAVFPVLLALLQAWSWASHVDIPAQGVELLQKIAGEHFRKKVGMIERIRDSLHCIANGAAPEEDEEGSNGGDKCRPIQERKTRQDDDEVLDLPISWTGTAGRWQIYAAVGVYVVAFQLMQQYGRDIVKS